MISYQSFIVTMSLSYHFQDNGRNLQLVHIPHGSPLGMTRLNLQLKYNAFRLYSDSDILTKHLLVRWMLGAAYIPVCTW